VANGDDGETMNNAHNGSGDSAGTGADAGEAGTQQERSYNWRQKEVAATE
jgi:hypothetical protein